MAIIWRDQMSIDGGLIDDDHRCLIGLVNGVDAVAPGSAAKADLILILTKLEIYARLHFEREERLQVAVAFTFQAAHHKRHNGLIRELRDMRSECDGIRDPQQLAVFHDRLRDFLYAWLVDHILKVDVLMKPFVAEMKKHAEAVSSLAEAVRLSAASRDLERAKAYGQLQQTSG